MTRAPRSVRRASTLPRRRDILAAFGVMTVWRARALAQAATGIPRVGLIHSAPLDDVTVKAQDAAFEAGMTELGWTLGKSYAVESRSYGDDPSEVAGLAAELARAGVRVIVTGSAPNLRAAESASPDLAVVSSGVGDPVQFGFARDLAHPTGRVTGLTVNAPGLNDKRVSLVKEFLPAAKRVAMIFPANLPVTEQVKAGMIGTAQSIGLELRFFPLAKREEIDAVFHAMTAWPADVGLLYDSPLFIGALRTPITTAAAAARLPLAGGFPELAEAGCLFAYAVNVRALWQRAAFYVDRILKGAAPADLPFEQPSRFELIVNLKTAKALGITLAPTILGRADRVIE